MLLPIVADAWSISGSSPVTTTSAVAAGRSFRSPVDVFPSPTTIEASTVAKPWSAAVTLYVPGGSSTRR